MEISVSGTLIGIVLFVAGLAIGWAIAYARGQSRHAQQQDKIKELEILRKADQETAQARMEELKQAREQLVHTFKSLSSDALKDSNAKFLQLAKESFSTLREGAKGDLEKRQQAIAEMLQPVKKLIQDVEGNLKQMEKARTGAYAGLQEQVKSLLESQQHLKLETHQLVQALRSPGVRGRWGEMQLKRAVEFAGMINNVDFVEQVSTSSGEEGVLRPDMIVTLPNNKRIIIDAKVPLEAYLSAIEAKEEKVRDRHFAHHARQVKQHVRLLSSKSYWRQFSESPDFVVLFLPGESFFSAALEQDPQLIENSAEERVLLATPTTLIALLKAVATGWREASVAKQARAIRDLGRELFERLCTQSEHMVALGKCIERGVEAYNRSVRSMDTRVMVTARKFETLPLGTEKSLPELTVIEKTPHLPVDGKSV